MRVFAQSAQHSSPFISMGLGRLHHLRRLHRSDTSQEEDVLYSCEHFQSCWSSIKWTLVATGPILERAWGQVGLKLEVEVREHLQVAVAGSVGEV
jgi:hypothetical protein